MYLFTFPVDAIKHLTICIEAENAKDARSDAYSVITHLFGRSARIVGDLWAVVTEIPEEAWPVKNTQDSRGKYWAHMWHRE